MKKNSPKEHNWLQNLRRLMEDKGFNPRSLSLQAGLNPTAIRDMLEGRINFPRYDTVQALAKALNTSPALLMGDAKISTEAIKKGRDYVENLDLLTEIIARLQEVIVEQGYNVEPRQFAAITATIYQRMKNEPLNKSTSGSISTKIHDLMEYETARKRRAKL